MAKRVARTNVANPERSEVDLPIVNKRTGEVVANYVLKFGMNTGVSLSKRLGKTIDECLTAIASGDVEAIREFVFVALQKHHSAEIQTPEDAGDLIDRAGGLEKVFGTINGLIEVSQPEGDANPQTAPPSTGDASTSTHAA